MSKIDFTQVLTAEEKSADETQAALDALASATDRFIEDQAQALGYKSADRLAGYVTSKVKEWQAEAQEFVAWRDKVWQAFFKATKNEAKLPQVDELLDELPRMDG